VKAEELGRSTDHGSIETFRYELPWSGLNGNFLRPEVTLGPRVFGWSARSHLERADPLKCRS